MSLYVDRMIADKWAGVFFGEEETVVPTIEDAEQAIQALDAGIKTLVSLYGRDGAHLTIGGGAGQYVVYASNSDEQLWNLIDDAGDGILRPEVQKATGAPVRTMGSRP